MKKEKLNLPYDEAKLEIITFNARDVIVTSGNTWIGDSSGDNNGWT